MPNPSLSDPNMALYVLDGREYILPKSTDVSKFWNALAAQLPPTRLDTRPDDSAWKRRWDAESRGGPAQTFPSVAWR